QKSGFSHAGLPDHIHMLPAVYVFYAKFLQLISEVGLSKICGFLLVVHIGKLGGGAPRLASMRGVVGAATTMPGK
ncbi:MAG: hypothetical protein UX18_C0011G0001, partial [Candidatus Azambacteria bacterium GW2011_GWC2_45_7b]